LRTIAGHPATFLVQTLKAFRANQGMLLAGAVAYYALLSIVPLLILVVIALSHLIDQRVLLDSLTHQLEWLVPGQAKAIVRELANFLAHRAVIGWVLLCTIIFFSSLAFTVLENAMSVIFVHRVAIRRRHFLISALLPYCYSLSLGMGVLLVTLVSRVRLARPSRRCLTRIAVSAWSCGRNFRIDIDLSRDPGRAPNVRSGTLWSERSRRPYCGKRLATY
jgi:uncharacterized BrkB/YihY/UPF0761 family membrane protein